MEPTAKSRRTSDIRTPTSAPRADSAPVDPLSSWDGPGTVYTVMPRPAAPSPGAARPPVLAEQPEPDDAPLTLQPARNPSVNWPLIGGAMFGALLTVLLIALWKSWVIDNTVDATADHEMSPNPLVEVQHPAQVVDSRAESTVPLTQEPMEDEPLLSPSAEPEPEEPQAALPEAAVSAHRPPAADTTVQAPPRQAQKQTAPTLPTNPPPRPAPAQAMTIVDRKPVAPARPLSVPAPTAIGTLIVAVQPWAEVWIDGHKRGISPPLFTLQLPPGIYTIELRNPDLPSYSQKVQLVAGQSVTLRHSFQ